MSKYECEIFAEIVDAADISVRKILKIAIPTSNIGVLKFCNQPINKNLKYSLKKITTNIIKDLS